MAVSCFFIRESGDRCGSKYNCKEVEFRHPDYSDLGAKIFLCEIHFGMVFGKMLITGEHVLPLEEETWLKQKWLSAKLKYYKDKEEVVKKVQEGIGLEFFNMQEWNQLAWQKVDDAYKRWQRLKRKTCRFEWCKKELVNYRSLYIIKVYPKNQMDYVNLLFCCLDHWEVFKKRCGLVSIKGSLNPANKKVWVGLDEFV